MAASTELQRISYKSNWRKLKIKGATKALKELACELQEYMTGEQLRDFCSSLDKLDNLLCRINEAKYLGDSKTHKNHKTLRKQIAKCAEELKSLPN